MKAHYVKVWAATCFFVCLAICCLLIPFILQNYDCSAVDVYTVEIVSTSPSAPSNCTITGYLSSAPDSKTTIPFAGSVKCLTSYPGSQIPACYNGFTRDTSSFYLNPSEMTNVYVIVINMVLTVVPLLLLMMTTITLPRAHDLDISSAEHFTAISP